MMIITNYSDLIGKIAVTDTEMSPKGSVLIEGKIYEAEAQDAHIDAGRGVKVVRVKGKKIFVKRV